MPAIEKQATTDPRRVHHVDLQRSAGRVELAFKRRGPTTALAHLHQAGCGKARLPRPVDDAHAEAVLINLAGGLTGGDRLDWQITWEQVLRPR